MQVPFARSSLNHDDVFILDAENKIYQFNGANSNLQERAKALEVIQFLKEKYHDGTCDVAIVGEDTFLAEFMYFLQYFYSVEVNLSLFLMCLKSIPHRR